MKNRIDPRMMFFLILIFMCSCDLTKEDPPQNEEVVSSPNPKPSPPSPLPLLPDDTLLTHDCFYPNSNNPDIESEYFFQGSHWNDPSVLKQNNQYTMYASSPLENLSAHIGIYRLISNDGETWTRSPSNPVLTHQSYSWASKGVETPTVIVFKGKYHMFFTAYSQNSPSNFKIGHAESNDGINWLFHSNYLIQPSGIVTDFDGLVTAEPGAVVYKDQIYLYFSGIGYHQDINDKDNTPGSIVQTIGFIKSSDGANWSSPSLAFRPDQKIYKRFIGNNNHYYGLSTPQPIVINDKLYIFHDAVKEHPSWHQSEISYAYSIDGETNWIQSEEPIFERDDFWWTEDEMRSPYPLLDGTTLKLWFAGHTQDGQDYTLGIGSAECEL